MSHELSELLEQIKFHLYNGLVTARGWGRGEQTSALKLSFIFYILIFKQWNITSVHIKHYTRR